MRVMVVGAGPTGLTAAVELARRGVSVRVVDRRDARSTFSRAVGIMPRSLETLEPSGVAPRLVAEGVDFRQVMIYRGNRLLLPLELAPSEVRHGYGFLLGLAQDRTEMHLAEALERFGGRVDYGTAFRALRQDETGVTAVLADGSEHTCDYLIGADGVRSTVRERLGIAFPGYDLPETWSIADVEARDWAHPQAFTACQLDAGRVVVAVPLEADRYRVISNTSDALSVLPLPMTVTKVRREGQFNIAIRQVEDYARGRVFLAGDAAHCHSPVGGRGMNLGIADAADLARRMVEGGLDGYSAARHEDGRLTIAGSERARKLLTSTNPLTRGVFLLGVRLLGAFPALQRRVADAALYG